MRAGRIWQLLALLSVIFVLLCCAARHGQDLIRRRYPRTYAQPHRWVEFQTFTLRSRRHNEHALFIEIARPRRAQHTGQKLAMRQWRHDEPSCASSAPSHAEREPERGDQKLRPLCHQRQCRARPDGSRLAAVNTSVQSSICIPKRYAIVEWDANTTTVQRERGCRRQARLRSW